MDHERLGASDLAQRAGQSMTRRSALRKLSIGAAALAGLVVSGGRAAADEPTYNFRRIKRPNDNKNVKKESCGVFCSPVDCCSNGCCSGVYLFRCENQCDWSYWFSASSSEAGAVRSKKKTSRSFSAATSQACAGAPAKRPSPALQVGHRKLNVWPPFPTS